MITIRRNEAAIQAMLEQRLQATRSAAIAQVNAKVGAVRSTFITTIPGQEMIYQAKETEAARYLALDPDLLDPVEFPFLAAEAGILAGTAYEVAQIWINMSSQWRGIAAQLEALRIAITQALESADHRDTITAIEAQFDHDLSAALHQL